MCSSATSLIHVLPGFRRVCHNGLFANYTRAGNFVRALQLLANQKARPAHASAVGVSLPWRNMCELSIAIR